MKKNVLGAAPTNRKPTTCDRSVRRSNGPLATVLSFGVAALVVGLFVVFLARPFVESAAPDATFPRWALLLAPLADADFLNVVWFGVDLPNAPYLGERGAAFGLGAFALLAALGLGGVAFSSLKRLIPTFKTNIFETIFFSVGIGLVLFATAFSWRGADDGETFVATAFFAALAARLFFRNKKKRAAFDGSLPPISDGGERISFPFSTRFDKGLTVAQLLLTALFASFYLFAATQPISEYDALEYHAQAAREIAESNALSFSTTNVYANMPLGAETFYLWGFRLANAVGCSPENVLRLGVLAGKTVLAGVALLTALGIFAFAVRFLRDSRAGLFAALLYLSFPNVFDVFSNGLNDGALGFALFAAFYAFLLGIRRGAARAERNVFAGFLGFFAGFAVSIKYTGVVFVAIPALVALCAATFFRSFANRSDASTCESPRSTKFAVRFAPILICGAAAVLASGSWCFRNFEATGNPVYPLAFGIFGDSSETWNSDVDARWRRAHSASDRSFGALADSISRPVLRDDLASPFFPFVPILGVAAVCVAFRRRENGPRPARLLAFIFGAIFIFWLGWHFATHRLTRFLVPIEPLAAVLLGAATSRISTRRDDGKSFHFNGLAKTAVLVVFAFGLCWQGLEIDLRGQGRLASLRALERDPARFPAAAIYFNDNPRLFAESPSPRPTKKLLLVGEAKAFAYRVPVLYSTCWNRSPLIALLDGAVERDASGKVVSVADAEKIRNNFRDAGVAFVLVDFAELARFRSPGNYGFSDAEIDENLFRLLERADVVERFSPPELRGGPSSTVVFRVR